MEFDKSRVYTSLNADELRAGDKVIVADDLDMLKRCVKKNVGVETLYKVQEETAQFRFRIKPDGCVVAYNLAYLVERKENCTNCGEGKWDAQHQKILCDPVHCGNGNVVFRNHEIEVCEYWKPKTEQKAEMPELISLGNGQYVEKEKHYRPFKDIEELVKVWEEKIGATPYWGKGADLVMPHIWVRHKKVGSRSLITDFVDDYALIVGTEGNGLRALFDKYTFLDGSPCGVEE